MERSTGYALLGGQRIAYEVIGDGAVDDMFDSCWAEDRENTVPEDPIDCSGP